MTTTADLRTTHDGYDGRLAPTGHPLHADLTRYLTARYVPDWRAPLPHEIRENTALAALRGVVALHSPAVTLDSHIVCVECAVLSWPPPAGGGVWAGTAYRARPCGRSPRRTGWPDIPGAG